MISANDRSIFEELKNKVLSQGQVRIKKVILFGSRAVGTAGPDSDFDLLVIEAGPVSRRDESLRLRQALGELPYPVDVSVISEEEFEETKLVVGGLAYPAHKHVLVLYENS
jgi:predicted nucleotidyltransferase